MADVGSDKQSGTNEKGQGRGLKNKLSFVVASIWSVYTLIYLFNVPTYMGKVIFPVAHRAVSVGLIAILVFLVVPAKKGTVTDKIAWYDLLAILFIIGGCTYVIINADVFAEIGIWEANPFQMFLAASLLLALTEATRRTVGAVIAGLIVLFFFYGVYSNYFPGFLHSTGFSYSMMLGWMYLSGEGLLGMIIGVVSTIVAGFVIFGGFLKATGASEFFHDLALATVGFMRGGAAKAAVVASTLFGTLSGSIAANVATTGQITIPLMKATGYGKNFAGAIEATASTGGMFMPPIMGATAFLIAEFLGLSYWRVCVAAFLPAIIYYGVLFIQVDLEAARTGLKGLPHQELPSIKKTLLGGWQYLFPFAVLIFFLGVLRYSADTSIMYTLVALVAVSMLKKKSRLTPKKLVTALEDSARGMMSVAPIAAVIGILVGSLQMTGAGINLSSRLLDISGGNLLAILAMAAVAAFILGMGMPAVSVYILTVVLMAPALIKAGVEPIAAHMFLFYFGCLSFITPPVCVAAYIAAGISGGDPWKTAFRAVRLGMAAFLVPWAFVFTPGILAIGSGVDVLLSFILISVGCGSVAIAFAGFLFVELKLWKRALLALAGICMLVPSLAIRSIAIAVIVCLLVIHLMSLRKIRADVAAAADRR